MATVGSKSFASESAANVKVSDPVAHPAHYQSSDGIECIQAIRAALGLDGLVAYCRGNAIKYAWRSDKKVAAAEDLRKAAWYLTHAAEALESQRHYDSWMGVLGGMDGGQAEGKG